MRHARREMVCRDGISGDCQSASVGVVERGWRATRMVPKISRNSFTKSSSSHCSTDSSAVLYKASKDASALDAFSSAKIMPNRFLGECPLINFAAVDAHTKSPWALWTSSSNTSSPGHSGPSRKSLFLARMSDIRCRKYDKMSLLFIEEVMFSSYGRIWCPDWNAW